MYFHRHRFFISRRLSAPNLSFQNIKYKKNKRDIGETSVWKNECKKYLSLGRNAIVVIFGTVLAYILSIYDIHPFTLTGKKIIPLISRWNLGFSCCALNNNDMQTNICALQTLCIEQNADINVSHQSSLIKP